MLTRRVLMAGAGAALFAGRAAAQDRTARSGSSPAFRPAAASTSRRGCWSIRSRTRWASRSSSRTATGAAGMIAANAVAKAPPDGHMLLMATSGEIAISHHLYKEKMTYDPMRELAPIALVGIVPCVVVVAEATPVRTPQELVAYAKANAGKLSFSSSGVGNPQQLAGELMNIMAGTQRAARAVPGRGAGGDRRRDRHRDHELHEPCRRAGPDAGGQGPRGRGHLARAHAATARCRAAAEWRAGAEGLRAAQLVRPVHDRRHAGGGGGAAQRDRHESAGRAEDRWKR